MAMIKSADLAVGDVITRYRDPEKSDADQILRSAAVVQYLDAQQGKVRIEYIKDKKRQLLEFDAFEQVTFNKKD